MLVQKYLRNEPADSAYDDLAGLDAKIPTVSSRRTSISADSQISQNSRTFEHYREPTIADHPGAILLIQEALDSGDCVSLANLVRTYGLPPSLRAQAWPVLLRSHPSVLDANKSKPGSIDCLEERILKRLRGDLRRMERMRGGHLNSGLIEEIVTKFLRNWGDRILYESPMIWIADFLISGEQAWGATPHGSPGASVASSLASSPTSSSVPTPLLGSTADAFAVDSQPFTFNGIPPSLLNEVFENVMLVMADKPAPFSEFISMIRSVLPTLNEHFQREGILTGASSGDVWLVWWLRWMGIRAFPSPLLERLWDEYFSFRPRMEDNSLDVTPCPDNLNSFLASESVSRCHLLNCITLMKVYMGKLLELDVSECRQFLSHLPEFDDMEAVIKESKSLSAQYQEGADR